MAKETRSSKLLAATSSMACSFGESTATELRKTERGRKHRKRLELTDSLDLVAPDLQFGDPACRLRLLKVHGTPEPGGSAVCATKRKGGGGVLT